MPNIEYHTFDQTQKKYADKYVKYMNHFELKICKDISAEDLDNITDLANKKLDYEYSWEEENKTTI